MCTVVVTWLRQHSSRFFTMCLCCQVDNQLLGTTQPVILCVTPSSSESGVSDSGPALQVNAVKVPSRLMLTELFKVTPHTDRSFGFWSGFGSMLM